MSSIAALIIAVWNAARFFFALESNLPNGILVAMACTSPAASAL